MSCSDFERLIALYVEDDLYVAEQRQVESHLNVCPECRSLAADLKRSQAVFTAIRRDLPDQMTLLSIRTRVLDEVAGMQSGNWFERWFFGGFRQRAMLAGIAMLFVGGWVLWSLQKPQASVALPDVPVVVYQPAVVTLEPLPQTPPPVPAPKRRIRQPRLISVAAPVDVSEEPQPPVTIKFVTDNPNVIIYWLGDERKGD
jgi:anti-sigma factor RsiW